MTPDPSPTPEPEIIVVSFRQAMRPLLYLWLGLGFLSFMAGLLA